MHIQYGLSITSANDPLQKLRLEQLHRAILHPKPQLAQQIKQLRLLRSLDERQYRKRKTSLPYFTLRHFHPAIRRKTHFTYIEGLMLDLDHLEAADIQRTALSQRLAKDQRVVMVFTSPGGDGLKVLFRLAERCYDAGLYAYFYQAFAQKFAQTYQLEKVVDFRTHDVTRACFLSVDPQVYYQPEAEALRVADYFDAQAPGASSQVDRQQKELIKTQPATPPPAADQPLTNEVLLEIKQKLNPNYRPRSKRKRSFEAPPAVKEQLPAIESRLQSLNMELLDTRPIQYGIQLRVAVPPHWAEVNIFHGQKGFTIVKSSKTGSQPELADILVQVVEEVLFPEY